MDDELGATGATTQDPDAAALADALARDEADAAAEAAALDADLVAERVGLWIEADPTDDGKRVDPRPITDVDFQIHVPPHIRDNYAALVREQHGGDWHELADRLDREADAIVDRPVDVRPAKVLAAWARAQANGPRAQRAEADDDLDADLTDAGEPPAVDTPDVPDEAPAKAAPPKGRTAPAKSTTAKS